MLTASASVRCINSTGINLLQRFHYSVSIRPIIPPPLQWSYDLNFILLYTEASRV